MKFGLEKKQILNLFFLFFLFLVLVLASYLSKQRHELRKLAEEVRKEIVFSLDPQTNNQANPWGANYEEEISLKIKNITSGKTLKFRVIGVDLRFDPQFLEIQTANLQCNYPFTIAGGNVSKVENNLISLVCYLPPAGANPSEPYSLNPGAEIVVGFFKVKVKPNPPAGSTTISFVRTNIPEEETLEDLSKFGENGIYYVSSVSPTLPPGEVKVKLKVKFDGVYEKKGDQEVRLKVGKGETILQELSEIALTANNQGVYESDFITLSSAVTSGSDYYLLIKGPKHLQVRFCQNSGQHRPCTKGNITLNNGENILDFTGYPLPGGDLPPQDGVVNALDAVVLVSCFNEPTSQTCLDKADLNFDGIVNTMDINIMNNTIYTRWEDE